MISEKSVYHNQCKSCEYKHRNDCGPIYCYNCGDYRCSKMSFNPHTCDPKRVKRHYAAMEAANNREGPITPSPTYSQQLADGFAMMHQDNW